MLQPKIPPTASELCAMLPTTDFGNYYKFSVTCGNQTAVVFFSDKMNNFLTEVTNIQFDGTFFTVPVQFFQLWTIFVAVGRHTLPAIHCLMTAKSQDLYQAILENISVNIPLFQPSSSMSDWEPAARIAFRNVYPQMKVYGCWFHFTQRIWMKTQKVGLSKSFRDSHEVATFIRQLMAMPFLPASLITPTYNFLQLPTLENPEMIKLEKLKKYFQKRWLTQITPEELSIFDINISKNNAAESYHFKIKSIIKIGHPRIWSFMKTLNEIIQDTDNEIGRLRQGREISRPRKKKHIKNDEHRFLFKQRLTDGLYSPWEFLQAIGNTIGNFKTTEELISSDSEQSEEEHQINNSTENKCAVCLLTRTTTCVFIPCRHAACCISCSERIEELGQPCPICRAVIEDRFQIFTV